MWKIALFIISNVDKWGSNKSKINEKILPYKQSSWMIYYALCRILWLDLIY